MFEERWLLMLLPCSGMYSMQPQLSKLVTSSKKWSFIYHLRVGYLRNAVSDESLLFLVDKKTSRKYLQINRRRRVKRVWRTNRADGEREHVIKSDGCMQSTFIKLSNYIILSTSIFNREATSIDIFVRLSGITWNTCPLALKDHLTLLGVLGVYLST